VDGGRHMQRHPSPSASSTITGSSSSRGSVRGRILNNWKKKGSRECRGSGVT
jgi:hypothetical protein